MSTTGRSVQYFELFNQRFIVARALAAIGLNELENHAQSVKQMQQAGNHPAAGNHFAVAQQSQKILAAMGELLEPLETKKSRGSLDGVHGAKDLAQQRGVLRTRFKIGQAPLHAVQALLALDKELSRQFIHGQSLIRCPSHLVLTALQWNSNRPGPATLMELIG